MNISILLGMAVLVAIVIALGVWLCSLLAWYFL